MTLNDALRILSSAQHRGVHWWLYDRASLRVIPAAWPREVADQPPAYTAFEACAIARGLVGISKGMSTDMPGRPRPLP